ncbi:MAG: exonuclease domain-containing protein [Desulfobacterales bacterium]|jgi:DNA polymerase-3 subunit epsilon
MNLNDLEVLTLDCQATGANPQKGHLLEIGWVQTCAATTLEPETLTAEAYLVALPAEVDIPPAVQRVTGITQANVEGALPATDIWLKLSRTAKRVTDLDLMEKCPIIIHYAHFEKAFLEHLHAHAKQLEVFPFDIICTHEIAKRLLPGLPRRGLRAVAGYFGHSVPQQRRSGAHAVATAVIWQHIVRQLANDHGVENLDQLNRWLKDTTPQTRTGRDYPMQPDIRLNLPDKPGIYRMLRSNGDLLYIGKATSLKQRVNSYFRQKSPHGEHTLEMLSQAADLEVTRTVSALEAAALESDEIKRHSPPYNIALQTGQRTLIFGSCNLNKYNPQPDATYCIGPLPKGLTTAALHAFANWHKDRGQGSDNLLQCGYAMLGVPQTYAPEPDCLSEGLALFEHNHRVRLTTPSVLRVIAGLGRKLWGERLKAIAEAKLVAAQETDEEALDATTEEPEEEPSWTPEAVVRGLEHTIMRGAHLIRRARWLCMLSESSLAWTSRYAEDQHKHVLLFENGAIRSRQELPTGKTTPLSAGYAKLILERQKIFDVTTYERLRVVTTELRRLVGDDRNVELRLSPNAILSRRQLARLLPWV